MAKKSKTSSGGLQYPMFAPASDWTPPDLGSLPSWASAKRIAVDVETRDDGLRSLGIGVRRGGYVVGYSFTIEGGPSYYLPTRHEGGDNLPEEAVLGYLRSQAKSFSGDVVGANLSYDLDYLWENGIEFGRGTLYRDIQIADPLIYELHLSYSMANIAQRWGMEGKDQRALEEAAQAFGVDPKGGLWRLPARYVGRYAERDTALPLAILRAQEKQIDQQNLWDIWNLESKVLPILVKLRRRGVRIDQDKLSKIYEWSMVEEQKALDLVYDQTGFRIPLGDLNRVEALAPALSAIGVTKLPKTAKGADSIDKGLLASLNHPVAKAILRARKVNKLRTTFVASIRRYMTPQGRIHCTFKQIASESESGEEQGARYGRLSAVDPNMQQQPSRDEFAAMWRSIYIPEDGAVWGSLDYSQQEPRWTTHFAALTGLTGAADAAQAYWDNPLLDNHDFMAKLTGLDRKYAKNIYLGLCYGEGGYKLCQDLGLPTRWAYRPSGRRSELAFFATQGEAMEYRSDQAQEGQIFGTAGEEGQEILNKFDERAPFIRQLARKAKERASKLGIIRTAGGRNLHFPTDERGNFEWTHKALNRLIQGSSADQMKTAMVAIEEQYPESYVQLQVHDELDGSFGSVEEANKLSEVMKTAMPGTKVPFRVDVETGPSWGEVK